MLAVAHATPCFFWCLVLPGTTSWNETMGSACRSRSHMVTPDECFQVAGTGGTNAAGSPSDGRGPSGSATTGGPASTVADAFERGGGGGGGGPSTAPGPHAAARNRHVQNTRVISSAPSSALPSSS